MNGQKYTIEQLNEVATKIREDLIKSLLEAKSGHSAGPMGMADVFTALYWIVLKHNPNNPEMSDRDRVFLSNGHICPIWYTTLAHAGYFPVEELMTLRKLNSRLQGHPNRLDLPGVENSSGPLGQGISQAVGSAIAGKMNNEKHWIYCVMGDGELNEGQCWEAFMLAKKYELNNLTVIVDRNNIQIDGYTEDVMPLESLKDKFEAFGFHVKDIDGHNIEAMVDACNEAKAIYNRPSVIIANTIPGKGVDFMEWVPEWHGKPPNEDEAKQALRDIRTLKGNLLDE